MIDYRALLKKYMEHILHCEGMTYTETHFLNSQYIDFTNEEKEALQEIEKEL